MLLLLIRDNYNYGAWGVLYWRNDHICEYRTDVTKNKATSHWDKHAGRLVITLFSNVAPTENGSSYRMEAQEYI